MVEFTLANLPSALSDQIGLIERKPLGLESPGGVLRRYARDLGLVQRCLDCAAAAGSLWLVSVITHAPWTNLEQALSLYAAMYMAVVARRSGLYGSFRYTSLWSLLRRLGMLWLCLICSMTLGLFLFKLGSHVSREQTLLWFTIYGLYLATSHLASRYALRRLREHGRNTRCDGYIGTREGLARVEAQLGRANWLGHTVKAELCWTQNLLPSSEDIQNFRARFKQGLPDQWIVEEPADPKLLTQLLECLQDQAAPVLLLPSWIDRIQCTPRYYKLGTISALELWGYSESATPLQLRIKYLIDKLVSGVSLILLSPVLATIGVLVKLDSPGPILFRQRRYGLNGHPFECLKFRTMTTQENGCRVVQAKKNDTRVTKVGAILRSWNLDELPQLINVWRGEMSLIGPRPHAEAHNEYYRNKVSGYMRRHGLRPGLTGWAQVLGLRGETETVDMMAARVKADLEYIQNWSIVLDIKIFLLTFVRWKHGNAY